MSVKKLIEDQEPTELVRSFVLPGKLTKKDRTQADIQLVEARRKLQEKATDRDLLVARLMQLKFQLEDYIRSEQYDPNKNFGSFLKSYLGVINRNARQLASEINVHKTLMSQLITNARIPNESIVVRLELHSNGNIPAHYWFQIMQKDKVHHLQTNKSLRKQERENVIGKVSVKI